MQVTKTLWDEFAWKCFDVYREKEWFADLLTQLDSKVSFYLSGI